MRLAHRTTHQTGSCLLGLEGHLLKATRDDGGQCNRSAVSLLDEQGVLATIFMTSDLTDEQKPSSLDGESFVRACRTVRDFNAQGHLGSERIGTGETLP